MGTWGRKLTANELTKLGARRFRFVIGSYLSRSLRRDLLLDCINRSRRTRGRGRRARRSRCARGSCNRRRHDCWLRGSGLDVKRQRSLLTSVYSHAVICVAKARMPRTHVVFPGRNSIDAKRADVRRLREVGMIEDGDPCVRPRMLLADHLDFRRFIEPIYRHHLAVIIERRDGGDLAGANIDEPVGMQRPIVVADIQRARRRDHLDEWIENAAVVRKLEPALEWERLAAANVSQPDDRAGNARS